MSLTERFESLVKDRMDALQKNEHVTKGREKLDALVDRYVPTAVSAPLRKEMSLDSLGEAAKAAREELKAWWQKEEPEAEEAAAEQAAAEQAEDEAEARDAT